MGIKPYLVGALWDNRALTQPSPPPVQSRRRRPASARPTDRQCPPAYRGVLECGG